MRIAQNMAAGGLVVALAAAGYGIFVLGRPSAVSAKKKAAAAEVALVDQTPVKTAQQLAQSADTPEEQKLAKKALQVSDWELDLSFNIALQDAEAHPPELSAEAKEMQARLRKAQNLQQALQAQVDQLSAEIAKTSASRKDALQDQLDLARASLDVATNDVDDTKRDLSDAGGNVHDRIEKMKEQHEAADRAQANDGTKFSAAAPEQLGIVHRVQQWLALNSKKKLLLAGKAEADSLAASLAEQHNALSAQVDAEKFNSPDLAAHSKLAEAGNGAPPGQSAATRVTENVRKTRSAAENNGLRVEPPLLPPPVPSVLRTSILLDRNAVLDDGPRRPPILPRVRSIPLLLPHRLLARCALERAECFRGLPARRHSRSFRCCVEIPDR